MDPNDFKKLRKLTSFEALVDYLRDELEWPIEAEDAEKIAFEYDPKELRIDPIHAVKIESIKQIRPLAEKQPWGVFYIQFENKNLPVVVLRRILHALVPASRNRDPDRKAWKMSDLLFISSQGAENDRSISFAHFQEMEGKAQLRTFSWDVKETQLYYIKNLNLNFLHWPTDEQDQSAWGIQWAKAFIIPHRYVPTTAEMLSKEMARIAKDIREAVLQIYGLEHSGGPLHQLHLSLKMDLISDLSEFDFADMYAQTVTYGLFAARATRSGKFGGTDAKALIAHTNPFLRELLEQMMDQELLDLDELGVTELTELLSKVNMEAILQDFGRQKKGEDPVIHFYETFMREYDPKQKTRRGEFYTPDPVVSFIVRSVDYLLRTEFDCPDGLAASSPNIQGFQPVILDPATGTGTFLKYVIEVIWETFYEKNKKISKTERRVKWNQFVRENVLPRMYAFELKMSPYTIAHMKVGLALQEKGFDFEEGERLQIYLTNSLQPAHEMARVDTPALAHEAEKANDVKNNALVTVVIGNPPYSNFGMMNKGDWISELLEEYKHGLNEKKINLDDDFIKFLRFAQWRIDKTGQGILAYITNNTFIDGVTHRQMRKSLMESFDEIYIFDLHGSSKKGEMTPDGSKDENVFDIQQGVSISFFVKKGNKNGSKIYHSDLWGLRSYKYENLLLQNLSSITWEQIYPANPYYFFAPKDFSSNEEYSKGWRVSEIFTINQNGIKTDRDELFFDTDKTVLENRIKQFYSENGLSEDFIRQYRIENSSSYDILGRRAKTSFDSSNIHEILYRPFDMKWIYYSVGITSRPAWDVIQHLLGRQNIALLAKRQSKKEPFSYIWCTDKIMESCVFESAYANNSVFPLYLYPERKQQALFHDNSMNRKPNLATQFIKNFSDKLNLHFVYDGKGDLQKTFGPEDVFNYIYAVFHSPIYRARYAEFLKIDFPRLPLTSNIELFRQLCTQGKELVDLHLLTNVGEDSISVNYFSVNGLSSAVSKGFPKYDKGKVYINQSNYFEVVPEIVWKYQIGGYQVCEKWLKDRRECTLSNKDVSLYRRIISTIYRTIQLTEEVDKTIEKFGGWPIG